MYPGLSRSYSPQSNPFFMMSTLRLLRYSLHGRNGSVHHKQIVRFNKNKVFDSNGIVAMFSTPYKAVSCSPNMTWISKMSTFCSKSFPSNLNTSLLFSARKSTVSSDIVIREATVSDYAAVVDLIDEDGVHDYLPALYKHQVSDPDNFPYVATLGGRVVSEKCDIDFDKIWLYVLILVKKCITKTKKNNINNNDKNNSNEQN